MMNSEDRRILRHWQNHPQLSKRALADELSLSLPRVVRRIEAMKADNVIIGRRAEIDWRAFGYNILVFLRVNLDKTAPNAWQEFLEQAKAIEEIVVIESLLGRVDVRMNVRARDLTHYQEIYIHKILNLPHIQDVESLLMVSELKHSALVPL